MTQDKSNADDPSRPDSRSDAAKPPPGEVPPPAGAGPTASGPAGKGKKKRRLVVKILASLVVLILLLIVFAPTILSMGLIREVILQQVNSRMINGTLAVKDWSFGWTSGVRLEGISLTDANSTHLVSAHEISTPISLLKAITGNIDLGDVNISDVDFNAVRDRNGVINILQAFKPSNTPPSNQPAKLPNVKGVIHLKNITGTWEDDQQVYTFGLNPLNATITIRDINQPIEESVTLVPQLEDGDMGTVKIDGTLSAIRNNLVDVAHVSADQTIEIDQLDLAPIARVLEMHHLKLTLTGIMQGKITAKVDTLDNISAGAGLSIADVSAGGPLLGNDAAKYQKIQIDLNASRLAPGGQQARLKLDLPITAQPAGATADLITILADVPENALAQTANLLQVIAKRAGGGAAAQSEPLTIDAGNGSIIISANVGVANLVSQLPHLMHLEQGTSLSNGRLTHETDVIIGNNQVVVATQTHLKNFSGSNAGAPVKLDDSDAVAGVTITGGAAPELRKINVQFTSAFANLKGGGDTLAKTSFEGSSDLTNLQKQLGQFVDLDALLHAEAGSHVSLAGSVLFHAHTDGDLTGGEGNIAAGADLRATNVKINTGRGTASEPKFTAAISGNLHHTTTQLVQAVHGLQVAIQSPAIDFQAGAEVKVGGKLGASVPEFAISKGTVDLQLLQGEIGGLLAIFVPPPKAGEQPSIVQRLADNSVRIASGKMEISGQGVFDQTGFGFSEPLAIQVQPIDLTVIDELGTPQTDHLPAMSIVISGNGSVSDHSIATLKDLTLTATLGSAGKPLFTAVISADATVALAPVDAPTGTSKLAGGSSFEVSRIELTHCQGDLPGLQSAYGPMLPLVMKADNSATAAATQPSIAQLVARNLVVCSSGTLTASMSGSLAGTTFTITKPLMVNIAGLTLQQRGGTGKIANFNNQNIASAIGGSISLANGRLNANLHTLSLAVGDVLKIQGNQQSPLDVAVSPAGAISAGGTISVNADLAALIKMGGEFLPADLGGLSQLTSGHVTGQIKTARNADTMEISADLMVTALTIGSHITNETVHMTAGGTVTSDLTSMTNATAAVETSIAKKISISNGHIVLAMHEGDKLVPVGLLNKLQSVDVEVDQLDVAKVNALMNALVGPGVATPLQITGGIATLQASVARHGETTTANVSSLLVQKLAIQSGKQTYAWPKDITAQLAASLDTLEDPTGQAPLVDQLAKLSVTALSADVGITQVTLANQMPIVVTGLKSVSEMAVQGGVDVNGEIAPAARLVEVVEGLAVNSYPYSGHYHFSEALAKDAAQARLHVQGDGAVTNFQVANPHAAPAAATAGGAGATPAPAVAFSEPNIPIHNGFDYDFATNSIIIDHAHPISIALQSTGALAVNVTGTINDLMVQRRIADDDHVAIQLNYDLAKLWTIVKPILPPDQQQTLADLVIAGAQQRTFTISGSYPAGVPYAKAISSIVVGGYFTVDSLSTHGVSNQNFDLPIFLNGGVLRTVYPGQPEGSNAPHPATCNSGTLLLPVICVDLRTDPMLVSIPSAAAAHPAVVLRDVSINPTMAKTIFAKILNNPAFSNADNSRGLLTLSVQQLQQVPMSNLVMQQSPANKGVVEVHYSIRELQLGSPFFAIFGSESVSAEINNADVQIQNGRVTEDTTLMIDNNKPLRIAGVVILSSLQFAPMTVYFPPALLGNLIPANVRPYVPDQIVVPMKGDMNHPQLELDQVIAQTVKGASKKVIMNGLLNGAGGLFGHH